MQTIQLNKNQENELEQIYKELVFALKKTYTEEQLAKFTISILKESSIQTYSSKKDVTIGLFKTLGKLSGKAYNFSKDKIEDYKQNGLIEQWNKDLNITKKFINNTPAHINTVVDNVKDKWSTLNNNFISKSKDEKIEIIATSLMGILIFYASAGGTDFEGGIPDTDLMLGIGFHRNILSHSIIVGLLVEILMRSGIEIINQIYQKLPKVHHQFWDNSFHYINKHKGIAVGAMWAGISVHLLQDSGIFGHGVKPYIGIPLEMSMEAHQGLFAANGAASAIIAGKNLIK